MSLTEPRNHYKPFAYPWAFDAYHKQQKMHWLPEEVPLHNDVRDWKENLSEGERNLITQILRFFTQGDVDIAQGYIEKYLQWFKPPEVRMMLTTFASMEAVHAHAYSTLIDTLGMPEDEYQKFKDYQEMLDKHKYLFQEEDKRSPVQGRIRDIAVFSAFGEGMQLFSSFVILLNFKRRGLLRGMGQIIEWSIRDESLHVDSMLKLLHAYVDENPQVWTDPFKAKLYQACRDMVDLEDAFIDLAFDNADIEGLTKDEVKQYIRYIADRRLLQLGLKPNYGVKENPVEWLDWILNSVEHTNFFENRATEYAKGNLSGNWSEAFD